MTPCFVTKLSIPVEPDRLTRGRRPGESRLAGPAEESLVFDHGLNPSRKYSGDSVLYCCPDGQDRLTRGRRPGGSRGIANVEESLVFDHGLNEGSNAQTSTCLLAVTASVGYSYWSTGLGPLKIRAVGVLLMRQLVLTWIAGLGLFSAILPLDEPQEKSLSPDADKS